jgi:hypothetical protein
MPSAWIRHLLPLEKDLDIGSIHVWDLIIFTSRVSEHAAHVVHEGSSLMLGRCLPHPSSQTAKDTYLVTIP